MREDPPVGARRRVVRLVDDDGVEVVAAAAASRRARASVCTLPTTTGALTSSRIAGDEPDPERERRVRDRELLGGLAQQLVTVSEHERAAARGGRSASRSRSSCRCRWAGRSAAAARRGASACSTAAIASSWYGRSVTGLVGAHWVSSPRPVAAGRARTGRSRRPMGRQRGRARPAAAVCDRLLRMAPVGVAGTELGMSASFRFMSAWAAATVSRCAA